MGFLGSPSDHNTVVPGKRLQRFPKILSRPKLSQFYTKKAAARHRRQLFRKREENTKSSGRNSEHILVVVASGADELHPLGHVDGVVADALQILDDHQQVERGVHLGGVGGDLLSEGVLDGVEVIVHLVVGGNDLLGGRLILPGQGGEGVQMA